MKKYFFLSILLCVASFFPRTVFAQWTKTVLPDPPYGHGALPGRVSCLATDSMNVFAGTLGGNVYKSSDNGNTWVCIDSGLTTSDITSILATGGMLYVGCYGNIANATYGMHGSGSGVYISTDQGTNWKKADSSLADTNIYTFARIDSVVFAGTWGGGIYMSSDSGDSWVEANNGLTNSYVRTIASDGKRIFAGTWGDGIFYSDDYGQSWTQSNLGINNLFVYNILVDSPNVYMGNTEGVYFSNDDGFSWSLRDSGLTTTYINTFVILNPDLFVGTSGQGVFVSLDNGTSWTAIDTGLTDGYIYCFVENGSKLFAGSSNGEIWSLPISAMMAKVTDIRKKSQQAMPGKFSLSQNYPNPFNPTTVISYTVPADGMVTLTVYDALGREVRTLVSANQTVGQYKVTFEGTRVASGMYFYQLRCGTYISTRKMLLMK
ncbi:MAG TPA: T9SS type A sorting domain-containing protein [Candidatus Acidoferrales bacterium]|nr:T9SS type A sorting domain-containing protein [Candidatus Acidoferrales bacterium]